MRPQEIDLIRKKALVHLDKIDEMFLAEHKEFYEELIKLNSKEKVFDGEHGES